MLRIPQKTVCFQLTIQNLDASLTVLPHSYLFHALAAIPYIYTTISITAYSSNLKGSLLS